MLRARPAGFFPTSLSPREAPRELRVLDRFDRELPLDRELLLEREPRLERELRDEVQRAERLWLEVPRAERLWLEVPRAVVPRDL